MRCPWWTRKSPWEAPATALTAAEAAGMPVRRPRRPVAVSAAFEAGAGPELGCAGQLEPADRPAVRGKCALGWVCRPSLWVWWSSLVGRSISRLGLLGSCARAGALGFGDHGKRIFGVSDLLRVWWSVCGCVCACLSTRLLCRVPPLVRSRSLSFDLDLARGIEVNRRCLVRTRPWRYARAAAARSALFGVFGDCGCGVF